MKLDTIMTRYRQWRAYRRVLGELSALDQRELDDLGIGRWRIEHIARTGV